MRIAVIVLLLALVCAGCGGSGEKKTGVIPEAVIDSTVDTVISPDSAVVIR